MGSFGSAVADMAEELSGISVLPIDFGGSSGEDTWNTKYERKRDQMYWNLRCLLEADMVVLLPDEELMAQLTSIKYAYNLKGQIKVESKKDIKKRGLDSPDCADMLAMLMSNFFGDTFDEGDSFGETQPRGTLLAEEAFDAFGVNQDLNSDPHFRFAFDV